MRTCDEVVVKFNRLIGNCGPGKRLFDALASCFSESSGLFSISHEVGDFVCEIMFEFIGI